MNDNNITKVKSGKKGSKVLKDPCNIYEVVNIT